MMHDDRPPALATTLENVLRALAEGRAAAVGAENPYRGAPALGIAWRRGYSDMMRAAIVAGPAHQRYLAARRAMFTHAGSRAARAVR